MTNTERLVVKNQCDTEGRRCSRPEGTKELRLNQHRVEMKAATVEM